MKVKTVMYLHGDKCGTRYDFERLCEDNDIVPTEHACQVASGGLYEVALDVEVDLKTGVFTVLGVHE